MPRFASSILVQVDAADAWAAASMVNALLQAGYDQYTEHRFIETEPLTANDFDLSDDQTEVISDDPADRAGELRAPLFGEDHREFIGLDDEFGYDGEDNYSDEDEARSEPNSGDLP